MTKHKSSKSSPKRPAQSKHGLMGMDKSHTSTGMKLIIGLLIVAFVSMFLYGGIASVIELFKPNPNQTTATAADPVAAASQQFKPQADALSAAVESEPTSYTALVSLGNKYFDWAQQLAQASQTSTAAAAAAAPLWVSAKDTYGRAVTVQPGDPSVTIDYSIATFYSGDTTAAITIAEPVTKSAPTFAQAWFNLGQYYEASVQPAKAIAAYEQYLKLDPDGKQGNADFAKTQLAALKASSSTKP